MYARRAHHIGAPALFFCRPAPPILVAADERSEAAFGCAAVVKSDTAVCQSHPIRKVCGRYAPERSLAPLVSCYRTETLLVIDTFPTRQLSLSYKKSRHSASTLMYLSYTQRCRVYGV